MLHQVTEYGNINVDLNVYTQIAGNAATKCFGVKGMAMRSMKDGLVHLLRLESMSKGVSVRINDDQSLSIDLHIMVDQGVNIPVVCKSIISEVRYMVTKQTDAEVRDVTVFVDSMMLG